MSAKKRSLKQKDAFERFPPPEIDVETLDENYLFDCALSNTYQQFCGAFDAKDHLLANYIVERNLFNKRDAYGKTVLDLASYCGNKEFIKAVFDRTNEKEKIDENVLNLKQQLKPSNRYNFMHLACIWNHEALVKYFAEHPKLIVDPSLDQNELNSMSAATIQSVKSQITNPMFKTLGSVLLRSKTKTGESPKDLARRYGHNNLVEYLQYAEKRQEFIDSINDLKLTISDPEKHQNKLSKDEKKKLEKIYVETLDWVEKNKENRNIETLEEKIKETQNEIKPILDNMLAKIHEMNQRNSVSNNLGGVSARSKITTPLVTK